MHILIRDTATENHPIIGIGALGSPVAQHTTRDVWIGWESKIFIESIREKPTSKYGKLLIDSLNQFFNEIFLKDLREEGILSKKDLTEPSELVIKNLRSESEKAIKRHHLYRDNQLFSKLKKGLKLSNSEWESLAKTDLYRSKRCSVLARLMKIKMIFNKYKFIIGTKKELIQALDNSSYRMAVGQLIRMIKSTRVGNNMMDIVVCGAIPPYNALLGGKLVSLLLTSPEVNQYYKKKYQNSDNLIASAMKGKKSVKAQDLVLLGTTSLYGRGSSQYNRIKMPAKYIGGSEEENIEYKYLEESKGFGSFHFSQLSIELMNNLLGRRKEGRRVNSIFGEGTNPKMRKIREALELLGLPSEQILKHGKKRVVYGVPLASNFREFLFGLISKPKYIIPQSSYKKRSEMISDFWISRWLSKRIEREEVMETVKKHTLSYPITHGARVSQVIDESSQYELFK